MLTAKYQSLSKQDEFVSSLLPPPYKGFYIDIGSNHAIKANNSYALELLGWDGLCVEINPEYIGTYKDRKCRLLTENALDISWGSITLPKVIDYISIDIDELSTEMLDKILVLEAKILTIEHDAYLYGDRYRSVQRKTLISRGYKLFAGDVLVEQDGFEDKKCPFEDWWINPLHISTNLNFTSKLPSEIIKALR